MASTFDPTANLLNAVNQTDRDVLAAQLLQQQSNTDQTDSMKQSMNDISRYTNNTLEGMSRDILNGKATTIDSIKENVNGNSRYTNDMISTIQCELLKGQYDTTITVKDQLTSLENNVEDHLGNMANVQSGQVADIKNNLYGIGKDIHTNAAGITSNIKDAIHAVDTSTMGLSAQLARDLNSESDRETGEQENELKEDLESENSDNLVEVTETSPCAEDEDVNELADDLQETQLEESEVVDKPVKKGRKKN
jgi:hypothetical protein